MNFSRKFVLPGALKTLVLLASIPLPLSLLAGCRHKMVPAGLAANRSSPNKEAMGSHSDAYREAPFFIHTSIGAIVIQKFVYRAEAGCVFCKLAEAQEEL